MFEWIGVSWQWLTTNASLFSAICTFGMFVIWFVYLQLLLHNFRMQRKPQIIINRGRGRDTDSLCLISNMSQEAVFVETIFAQLETSEGVWFGDITDVVDKQHSEGDQRQQNSDQTDTPYPLSRMTRQGPLNKGQYMEGGSFGSLIREVAGMHDLELDDDCNVTNRDITLQGIEIRLIAIFGSEKRPVGARRHFELKKDDNGRISVLPGQITTEQLNTRRQQLELRRWRRMLT
ncbi:hypothetical protein [Kushneria phosphatilytica]|uniref:Uncharacterized protein n=1 Tax=Kushneria phosphatilytica TaxID=657387 RepID=A0A1S1NPD2_9GAMM|nr:hypothetical protein [Kushneria phosphatilytica]OHV09933.1 hypothetical protein BH688_09925 [Kushneria phosphatilytica]QEL11603.1 hypothetical protein FY550_10995 [Kushneria phosphatilytica]